MPTYNAIFCRLVQTHVSTVFLLNVLNVQQHTNYRIHWILTRILILQNMIKILIFAWLPSTTFNLLYNFISFFLLYYIIYIYFEKERKFPLWWKYNGFVVAGGRCWNCAKTCNIWNYIVNFFLRLVCEMCLYVGATLIIMLITRNFHRFFLENARYHASV